MRKEITLAAAAPARCAASTSTSRRARSTSTSRSRRTRRPSSSRIQRLAHPDRRVRRPPRRSSWTRPPSARRTSTSAPRAARISRKLAVAYSNSQTALEGGALGWRKGSRAAHLPHRRRSRKLKPGEVSEPLRTPTGFHIVKLNEMRSAAQQQIVEQVHARHILMKTNELADDATVQQKLSADPRAHPQGRGLRGPRQDHLRGPGLGRRRRRPGLDRPRHLRAGVRADAGAA